MSNAKSTGSWLLFERAGIRVFLHWTWFLAAAYEVMLRRHSYTSLVWNLFEYLALFLIVLLHEFGHALACRSVGGRAERILLWPLGGIAFVSPPQRPGAVLWSIAAGPLVNVGLALVFFAIGRIGAASGVWDIAPQAHALLRSVAWLNVALLVFNLVPAYPLDGGQILRALLWYPLGRANSLRVAAAIGAVGSVLLIGFALTRQMTLLAAIGAFALWNCWRAFGEARAIAVLARAPRRVDAACPRCQAAPPQGILRPCAACGQPFDVHAGADCPHCGTRATELRCLDCGLGSPAAEWARPAQP